MTEIWVADTEPNVRFDLYTRGNAGEVFPHVITALTGSLIGDAVRRAQAEVLVETGLLRPVEATGPSLSSGVFGGYLYLNASVMRLFGIRMPGISWRDADKQVMGDTSGIPPYRPSKGDRNIAATISISRYSVKLFRQPDLAALDQARVEAKQWLATMPDLGAGSDRELLDWLGGFPARQQASMKRLVHTGMFVGAPRGVLDRLLDRPHADPGLVNRIVGGTGDIDSAQLAQRLWTIGRLVAVDESLNAAFDAGLVGIEERTLGTPLAAAVEQFLCDHGHRGNDEYELAAMAWSMDPHPVYAAVDRLRRAPADRDPVVTTRRLAADADDALVEALEMVPRPLRPLVRRAARVSRLGSIGRERAKDILVLENLGARLVLHELVRRAAGRGGPTDHRRAFCVTIDEFAEFVAHPKAFADVITERAELAAHLNDRVPPAWFEGCIPDASTWALRDDARPDAPAAGVVLTGIAVSGGVAAGPARVIVDPADPRGLEPGDVLVCAITDPSWTPLFLGACAVVCDSGAVQSHAAIVARELGLPAVLSVANITAIADGTLLYVDGHAGTVRIGDPPG
jgi:phosphohistidine swiveling domain-containing protein